jgi:hypothetical protein
MTCYLFIYLLVLPLSFWFIEWKSSPVSFWGLRNTGETIFNSCGWNMGMIRKQFGASHSMLGGDWNHGI